MKKILLIIIFIIISANNGLFAQSGLHISEAFTSNYRDLPGASETIMAKSKLRNLNLSIYHSLSIAGHPEIVAELEKMVLRDGASALSKEVRYAGGHLYYGCYSLPPVNGENRFILYVNSTLRGGDRIVLLYLEGNASIEDVKKMLTK